MAGSAVSYCLAEPIHRGFRLDRFSDLLVEPLPPLTITGGGCSLKRRKVFVLKLDLHRLLTDLAFQQGNALGIQFRLRANSFAGKC